VPPERDSIGFSENSLVHVRESDGVDAGAIDGVAADYELPAPVATAKRTTTMG
jgi:hypothetical protein